MVSETKEEIMEEQPIIRNLMQWFEELSLEDKLFLFDTINERNMKRQEQMMKQQMGGMQL